MTFCKKMIIFLLEYLQIYIIFIFIEKDIIYKYIYIYNTKGFVRQLVHMNDYIDIILIYLFTY